MIYNIKDVQNFNCQNLKQYLLNEYSITLDDNIVYNVINLEIPNVLKKLKKCGYDLEEPIVSVRPIDLSIMKNSVVLFKELLDISFFNEKTFQYIIQSNNPLFFKIISKRIDDGEYLFNPNTFEISNLPILSFAILENKPEVVKYLITNFPLNTLKVDEFDNTNAFEKALFLENYEILDYLIEYTEFTKKDKETYLELCKDLGRTELLNYLNSNF